jgi:hypothetical protein
LAILLTAAAAGGAWLLSRRDKRWLSWNGLPTLNSNSKEAGGQQLIPDSSKNSEHSRHSAASAAAAACSTGTSEAASLGADCMEPAQRDGRVVRFPDYLAQLTAATNPDREGRLLELHRAALVS